MYVQITTRCNMSCSHCLFSCGPRGEDMKREVFLRAVELAGDYGLNIFLGGGEPTLHPLFLEFVARSLVGNEWSQPGLVTNGTSDLDVFRVLQALARAELLYVGVSDPEDGYHDINIVKQHWIDYGCRQANEFGIRRSGFHKPSHIQALGRAKSWGEDEHDVSACYDMTITPRGTIYCCEWKHRSFGNIMKISDSSFSNAVEYCANEDSRRGDYFERMGLK